MAFFSETSNWHGKRRRPDDLVDPNVQARFAQFERRPYSTNQGLLGIPDSRFKPLNMEEIKRKLKLFDTDPLMRIAAKINTDAALGGSIQIVDEEMESGLSDEQKKDLYDWRAYTYSGFLMQAYRYLCAVGFVVWTWIPHPNDVGEPRVVNLESDILGFVHVNGINEPMYAFFRNTDMATAIERGTRFAGQWVGEPVEYTFVTTWNSPGPMGDLRSLVSTIEASSEFTADYRKAALRAELKRADPAMITEILPDKPDAHSTVTRGKMSGQNRIQTDTRNRISEAMESLMDARRELGQERFEAMYADVKARVSILMGSDAGRVDLPSGRKLAKQVMPEGPKDLIGVTLLHQQLLFTLFGIPPSFIQTESARGRISGGDDSNAASVFRNNQKQLKLQLVQLCSQAFNTIHNTRRIRDYLLSKPLTVRVRDEDVATRINRAKITIPGTPPEDYLNQLYKEGFLKYSAYRRAICTMHAFPEEDLNEEPAITLIDLITNGQQTLMELQMKHDAKMQKDQLEAKSSETEMKIESDEKKVDKTLKTQMAVATQKTQQAAKAKSKAKSKSKAKTKSKAKR